MADTDIIEEKIRELAYQLWEQNGSPEGKDDQFWHAAREMLADEGEVDAAPDPLLQVPIAPLAGTSNK